MKKLMLGLSFLCVVLFQNCAENVHFQENPIVVDPSGGASAPAAPATITESFKVNVVQNSTLDMMWVIDNSSSMTEEAAAVRSNLSSFLTSLAQKTDFRFLLLSNKGTYGATLPTTLPAASYRQLDISTDSYNGPQLLLNNLKTASVSSFFRSNSQKVIVFVSDDNSSLSATNFIKGLTNEIGWPQSQLMVSSFTGLGTSTSPCQWATGTNYSELAQLTGGKAYNICAKDWSAHFQDLLNKSISQAQRRFNLKTAFIQEILSVSVGGQPISSGDYLLENGTLVLGEHIALNSSSVVSVTYSPL